MKRIYNQKWLIISILSLIFIMIFSIKVYAENESFTFESEEINVQLNNDVALNTKGGSGVITYESENPEIASFNNNTIGLVVGKKIGTTTITATKGEEKATCIVNVVYKSITIRGQYDTREDDSREIYNLILNEHDTDKLKVIVRDGKNNIVEDAEVSWSSSDDSIVTIDNEGNIKGLKVGTATITAKAAGVEDKYDVTVYNEPVFTDFSNAKYELLFDIDVDLKITGVTSKEESHYYYIITTDKTEPTLSYTALGALDTETIAESDLLRFNEEENWFYATDLDKYVELNQNLYIWIIESAKLENYYYKDEDIYYWYSTDFVVEGKELTRPELNSTLTDLFMYVHGADREESSSIYFRFPTTVEKRKFKIKVGKVTDDSILQKIRNDDASGITSLLTFAKNDNNAIYTDNNLETTGKRSFDSDKALFDGLSLLEDQAYYYIYVEFDDENGKYYPIEGVTLGIASIDSSDMYCSLWAYTNENFEWNNLSSTPTEEPENKEEIDNTTTSKAFPDAGTKLGIVLVGITLLGVSVFVYRKYSKLKDI